MKTMSKLTAAARLSRRLRNEGLSAEELDEVLALANHPRLSEVKSVDRWLNALEDAGDRDEVIALVRGELAANPPAPAESGPDGEFM